MIVFLTGDIVIDNKRGQVVFKDFDEKNRWVI